MPTIGGFNEWAETVGGIADPAAVLAATGEYRQAEDHFGRFLAEAVELDVAAATSASELRDTYEQWCTDAGEKPWSAKAIGKALRDRGIDRAQVGRGKTWHWLGLRPVPGLDVGDDQL